MNDRGSQAMNRTLLQTWGRIVGLDYLVVLFSYSFHNNVVLCRVCTVLYCFYSVPLCLCLSIFLSFFSVSLSLFVSVFRSFRRSVRLYASMSLLTLFPFVPVLPYFRRSVRPSVCSSEFLSLAHSHLLHQMLEPFGLNWFVFCSFPLNGMTKKVSLHFSVED